MAKTNKADKAAEAAQDALEAQDVSQDTQEAECTPDGAQEGAEAVQDGEIPHDPYEELIEPDPAPEEDTPPSGYAVSGCDLLNLREGPTLDAPVVAVLPRGVGVSDTGQRQGEWWKVATGRLRGWVVSKYLEPVWG